MVWIPVMPALHYRNLSFQDSIRRYGVGFSLLAALHCPSIGGGQFNWAQNELISWQLNFASYLGYGPVSPQGPPLPR